MKLLTKQQQESYTKCKKKCYICKEKFENKYFGKVRNDSHYTEEYRCDAHSICNLKYNVSKKRYKAFYNISYYDNHFIIKELAQEFKNQLKCLGENT